MPWSFFHLSSKVEPTLGRCAVRTTPLLFSSLTAFSPPPLLAGCSLLSWSVSSQNRPQALCQRTWTIEHMHFTWPYCVIR